MKILVATIVVPLGACQRFYIATIVPGFNDFDEGSGKFAVHRVLSVNTPRVSVDHTLTVPSLFFQKQLEFTSQINSTKFSFKYNY